MRRLLLLVALTWAHHAGAQSVPDTLRAPAAALVTFAWNVDATDDWLLIGADEGARRAIRGAADILSDPAGTVFVYRLGGGLPVLAGRLESDRLGREDCFSWSMDVRGDVAAVGAYCETGGGAVYLYRFDGAAWIREAKLSAASLTGGLLPRAYFGQSVALGDGYLVVGSQFVPNPRNPTDDAASGAAFVFERLGGQWTNTATLVNDDTDGQLSEAFSISLATADDSGQPTIIVGAEQGLVPGSGARRGAVYVFERQGGQWMQQTRIGDPNTLTNDYFGRDLTWGDGGGLISAISAAYPLDRVDGVWSLGAALSPPGAFVVGAARLGQTAVVVGRPKPPNYTTSDLYQYTLGGPTVEVSVTSVPESSFSAGPIVSLNHQGLFYARAGRGGLSENYVLVQQAGATAAEAPPRSPSLLALAPNPTAGATRVQFETSATGPAHLSVVDALGRRITERALGGLAAGPHTVLLETGTLPAGVYLVRLDTVDGRSVRRLVRQ